MRRIVTASVLALACTVAAQGKGGLIAEQNGADVARLFGLKGWTDIEVTARHIDRIEAEACRGEARWRTTLTLLSGRVQAHERLGGCASAVRAEGDGAAVPPPRDAEDAAMRALERIGYTGVKLRKWGREGWRGTACRTGKLREVRVSADNRPAAPLRAMRDCPPGRELVRDLNAPPPEPPIRHVMDVKKRLLDRGYERIGRIEIHSGAFHAAACRKGWSFTVTVAPDGREVDRRNLGRCEGSTAPGPGRISVMVPAARAPLATPAD